MTSPLVSRAFRAVSAWCFVLGAWCLDEAEVLQRESLAVCRAVYGNRHLEVADACRALARMLADLGRDDEAMELNREAEEIASGDEDKR